MATMSDSKCEVEKQMRDDSTAQLHLESARMILLELLTLSNDIVSLLLSADELEVQTLTEIARQLLKVLNDICEHLTKLQPEILRLIGEVISSTESIAVMYKFHDVYFLKLGTGLEQDLVYSLLSSLNVLMILTEGSKGFCKYLVNSGCLYQNFFELEELKKTLSGDEFAHKFIISNLMILYNCSVEHGFHRYFLKLDPVYFLNPFCNSSHFGVKIHSKFIVGRLVTYIPSMNLDIIYLKDADIQVLCEMLGQASMSDKFEVCHFNCRFSATELLSGIRSVLYHDLNRKRMVKEGIAASLVAILVGGGAMEKKEVCLTMWDLVDDLSFVETLNSMELSLVDILTELESNIDVELKLLLSGLASSLLSSGIKVCPKACYKYGHYAQCIKQCNDILNKENANDDDMKSAHLLRAKCQYHRYRKEQLRLAGSILEEKDLRKLNSECCVKARDAIISLSKSTLDEEGSYMIDIAMMEYATETNGLKDISICLLCQRREKLVRSHMCPHSILKEFSAASTTPENLKVFDTSSHEIGHSKSPKQVTMYAFCKDCENVLSTYGEQEFLPQFFRKVYRVDGVIDCEDEQCIEYGPWLYHFCVGMLFRALIRSKISALFNSDEVYQFLLMCRNIILNPSLQQQRDSPYPQIFILIGPHKCSDQDRQYGFMNQVLNDAYLSTIQNFNILDGSTKPPYPAHFLLVHIGVINIITIFSPSSSCSLPAECQVDPIHGTLKVPAEKERGSTFTPGLWKFFRLYAMKRSRLWLERPSKPLQYMQKQRMLKPSSHLETVFHIESSVRSDLAMFETNVLPSPDPSNPRVISLLPSGFSFRPHSNPTCIKLPDNHHILFHFCEEDKEVYFVAVGNGGAFNSLTPYVIYSHCEPGLQFSSGFFIDPVRLTFIEFLPFKEGRVLLERLAIFDELKANIQVILRKMLRCKGVTCLRDVLQLCQFNKHVKSQSLDLRCFGREYCWYCVNRCSICLQLTGSNYSELDDYGRQLRFCSQECRKRLMTTVPLQASFQQISIPEEGENFVVLKVSGTGQTANSDLFYNVNLNVYIGEAVSSSRSDDSATGLNAFAFFHSRCLHLQTVLRLNVTECDSQITLSPLHLSLPQSVQESLNDITSLLTQTLAVVSVKDKLPLKYLYSFLTDLTSTVESSEMYPLNGTIAVKVPLPTLKVIVIHDLLKDTGESDIPKHNLCVVNKEEDQGLLCCDSYPIMSDKEIKVPQSLHHLRIEIGEDGLLQLLRLLPTECVVSTEFSTSASLVKFTEKCCVQRYILPMKTIEKFCLNHLFGVNNILKLGLKGKNDANENAYGDLYEFFSKSKICMKYMSAFSLENVGDILGDTMPAITSTLCKLIDLLYCGLSSGLSVAASQCFLASMTAVASLCDCSSKLRNVLLSSTKIVNLLLYQLQELRQVLNIDQFIKDLIVVTLRLAGSLARETRHHWQFMDADFLDVVVPYCCSSMANIEIAAKVALAPLSQKIEDDKFSLLKFPDTIIAKLKSSPGVTIEIFSLPLSQANVLWFLKSLLYHTDFTPFIVNALPDLLDSISFIIQQDANFLLEKKAALDLLWKLIYLGHKTNIISHPDLNAQLLSLTGPQEESLQKMASCVLWKLYDNDHEDMPKFYTEECYLNGYYNECVSECGLLLKVLLQEELHSKVMLMQGKALYHMYYNEQEKLKRHCLPDKVYWQQHSACYSKAKLAILTLGSLLDKGLLDTEGNKLLDLCMLDYIYATNDLQSCRRCLLCRKKKKLRKSHIWPRALLEDHSSGVEMPKTNRVFLVSWQSQNRYWSPKEVTFFMFCESCEALLNRHGENQFIPKFFRHIYDVTIAGKPQSASTIEYSGWLYEFCVGIVFRGIAQRNMLKFVNSEEIYEVLINCREFLLQCSENQSGASKLDICIMIGPTEAKGNDMDSGFINRVLNMPAFYGVEDLQLNDGLVAVPRAAHYFIAHLGLINILTKFKCSSFTFSEQWKINPDGGNFIVPKNEDRKCLFPAGVWTLFLHLAQDFEVSWLTRSSEAVKNYCKSEKKEPNEVHEDTFGFVNATQKDFEALQLQIRPPALSGVSKAVSFLPKQFKLQRSNQRSYINLPKSHHILLHYVIPLNESVQETLFLCVGNEEGYSHSKPYVIYHYFRQDGLQLSAGFFISPDDLSAQEFLPETADMFEVDKLTPIIMFREYIPKLLSAILEEKGFSGFSSLYLRLQNGKNVSTLDMKCKSQSRCWYCKNRCELCMKETGFGCLCISSGPIPLCFCSDCQHLYIEKKTTLVTKVHVLKAGDPLIPLAVSPLSSSHKALLYFVCETTTSKGAPVLMRMTLCSGKHSDDLPIEAPYVMYHDWTLLHQQFLEFTVSQDMIPDHPVTYTEGRMSEATVIELRKGPVRQILVQGIQIAGYEDVDAFIASVL